MAKLLYRLGRTAYRRWPVFVAAPEGESLTTHGNQKAVAELVENLAALDDVPDQISYIWTPEQAEAAAPAYAEAMSAESGRTVTTQQAQQMLLGQLQAQPTLSEDGRIGLISTEFEDVESTEVTPEMQPRSRVSRSSSRADGLRT